jgi:putative acetyltransferase
VLIRRERPGDHAAVRAILAGAFTHPDGPGHEPVEVALVDALRADAGWLPEFSMVAEDASGAVLGHVLCTRGGVDGTPALGLAPLAVRPDHQRAGVGSALMHAVLGAADAAGEPFVALLGEPDYYARFGFRPATGYRIEPPEAAWGDYFQVRTLAAYREVSGTFRYAAPFAAL